MVFVVDVVGPLGGGGSEELEIVSVKGGLCRDAVVDMVLLEAGRGKDGLNRKVRCCGKWEARLVDRG